MLHVPYIIALATVIAVSVLVYLSREREFRKTTDALHRIISSLDAERIATMDRWYLSRNLPPTGINLTAEHIKRAEELKARAAAQTVERVNGGPLIQPEPVGPLDSAQLAMEVMVRRRRDEDEATRLPS